jgi:hypothetical protein
MAKKEFVTYYAYADELTKKWYLYNTPVIKETNLFLLFELTCEYSDIHMLNCPDESQPVIDGVYFTVDKRWIRVLQRKWYGIKYQPQR